jgi:hypothetical protein
MRWFVLGMTWAYSTGINLLLVHIEQSENRIK